MNCVLWTQKCEAVKNNIQNQLGTSGILIQHFFLQLFSNESEKNMRNSIELESLYSWPIKIEFFSRRFLCKLAWKIIFQMNIVVTNNSASQINNFWNEVSSNKRFRNYYIDENETIHASTTHSNFWNLLWKWWICGRDNSWTSNSREAPCRIAMQNLVIKFELLRQVSNVKNETRAHRSRIGENIAIVTRGVE